MKVIVVDDDKIIRMGLVKMIVRLFEEHEIIGDFQNGEVALEYLKKNKVDLVITDIKMPIMTGIELIEKSIIELENPPTFVILSGYDEFTYVRDSMKSGAFNYLLKPIKQEDLKNVINEVEINIKNKKEKEKIINKSIDVLKKDFFKNLLFSNREIANNMDKNLLKNIQLDCNYTYQMIAIDDRKESLEMSNSLLKQYIKSIVSKYNNTEYIYFKLDKCIYLIFYYIEMLDIENRRLDYIVEKTNMLLEKECNVFILETTEEVWKLRNYSRLIKRIRNSITLNDKPLLYYLDDLKKLEKVLEKKKNDTNVTAIKLAKEYIINNYNKNITLKDIADEVFLSQNYLSELFKKEIGQGFYEFLSSYRIKKAKEILITTNLKIYEISESVGYNDAISFGRAFKKITGTTPNHYRNNKID